MSDEKKPEMTPEEQAPETFQSRLPSAKRTALLRYMAVMFAAAFALVLLSMILQTRDSNSTIDRLSQTSASALARAEQLQAENRALQQALTEAREETARTRTESLEEGRQAGLTQGREEGREEADNIATAYDALVFVLTTEPADGDVEYSRAVETVINLKQYLSDKAYRAFEQTVAGRTTQESEVK